MQPLQSPDELKFEIIKNMNIEGLSRIARVNREWYIFSKNYRLSIIRYFLQKYRVEYQNPGCLIYRYPTITPAPIEGDQEPDFEVIFTLFLRVYYRGFIDCSGLGVTSVPILPNMIYFIGDYNDIHFFPSQPRMTHFSGSHTNLMIFDTQPEMTYFHGDDNQLIYFPSQPKMEIFLGSNNPFVFFDIQPEMTTITIDPVDDMPHQPKLRFF